MDNYCKILLIDDEIIMRQGMKHIVDWEKEGFQIVGEAVNGKEGLELIEELRPHIVLSDVVMPVLDGMELVKIAKQKYPDIQVVMLSGYDNFEYVKTALLNGAADYILKSPMEPENLLKTLKKVAEKIPGLILHSNQEVDYERILEGYLLGFEEKLNDRMFASILEHSRFRLFGIDFQSIYGADRIESQRIKIEIKDRLASIDNLCFMQAEINQSVLLYVLNYRVSKQEELIRELGELIDKLKLYQEKLFFVLGCEFTDMKEIKVRFQKELQPWAENSFYFEGVSFQQLDLLKEERREIEKFDFQYLTTLQQQEKYDEAIAAITDYIQQAVDARMDVYKLKNLTKNLLYNFILCIEDTQLDMGEKRQRYFREIDDSSYMKEFLMTLDEIIHDLTRLVRKNEGKEDELLGEILKYISENFAEPLDLKTLADKFNFNYTYLSSYFTSRSKVSFVDHLNKIRIEKACQLLVLSEMSIAQISAEVGYADHSYFCRVFKKITGFTPSNYRRRYEK